MRIERIGDCVLIVARLRLEQAKLRQCVEFFFVQLNPKTAQALPTALTVAAHTFGGRSWARGRHRALRVTRPSSSSAALGFSFCRLTAPTSIRSKWPSQSSRPISGGSAPEPSRPSGRPSETSAPSTPSRNVATSSKKLDMLPIKRSVL